MFGLIRNLGGRDVRFSPEALHGWANGLMNGGDGTGPFADRDHGRTGARIHQRFYHDQGIFKGMTVMDDATVSINRHVTRIILYYSGTPICNVGAYIRQTFPRRINSWGSGKPLFFSHIGTAGSFDARGNDCREMDDVWEQAWAFGC